ncbi:MAG: hypothetical protein AAF197_05725 [Pseudomonadota bacterium]
MIHSPINIGVDTSKDQLDIGILPSNHFFSVTNLRTPPRVYIEH